MSKTERKQLGLSEGLSLMAIALSLGLAGYFSWQLDSQVAQNAGQAVVMQTFEVELATSQYQLAQDKKTIEVVQSRDQARIAILLQKMIGNSKLATQQAFDMLGYRVEATQDALLDNPQLLNEILNRMPSGQLVNSVRLGFRDTINSIPPDFELSGGSGLITKVDARYIEVVTARHVVQDANRFGLLFLFRPQFNQNLHFFDMSKDVQYAYLPDKDLGLIRIKRHPGDGMDNLIPTVTINEGWRPNEPGEILTGLSYPHTHSELGYFPSIFRVSDVGSYGSAPIVEEFYLGGIVSTSGASGGVIFDSQGEAVAIYVGAYEGLGIRLVPLDGISRLSLALQP